MPQPDHAPRFAGTYNRIQCCRTPPSLYVRITVLTRDDLEPGMTIVDGQYGLPPLPKADFTLIWGAGGKTPAAREFGRLILDMPGSAPEVA